MALKFLLAFAFLLAPLQRSRHEGNYHKDHER